MTFREKVAELVEEGLKEKPSIFLIDLNISDNYKISVVLDGDNGVTLQDCIDISRAVEHNLDREEHDFSLEVASAGVSSPLKLERQYRKNVGRTLKVRATSGEYLGVLTEAGSEQIVLEWDAREPKKIGKGKENVHKKVEIPYADIREAVVTITF